MQGIGERLQAPPVRPPRPAWEVGCSGDVPRFPSRGTESTSGSTDERVQVRAGAWAGASRGWERSSVHGTSGHPWAARVLSAGARGHESPELVALEWRAGRGLRRITGRPRKRLFLSCAVGGMCPVQRRRSSTSHPGLGALRLQRWSAGCCSVGSVGTRPSSVTQGHLRSLVTFHPKLWVFVRRCAAMAAGKVSVWVLNVP